MNFLPELAYLEQFNEKWIIAVQMYAGDAGDAFPIYLQSENSWTRQPRKAMQFKTEAAAFLYLLYLTS